MIMSMTKKIGGLSKRWVKETRAVAAMESMFIFPVMMTMLFGTIDIGTAVVVNTKVVSATQIVSDLVTRQSTVNNSEIADIHRAGEAALIPYNDASVFGLDVAGVLFEGEEALPVERWRYTSGMSARTDLVDDANGLGFEGEGVVIVATEYRFTPRFSGYMIGDITMSETSFVKGRDSAYVELVN